MTLVSQPGEQAQLPARRIRADFDDPRAGMAALRTYVLVYIALKLGLGTMELSRLTYGDIDESRARALPEVRRKGGKTGRLPLSPDILSVINEWRDTLGDAGIPTLPNDPIICALRKPRLDGVSVALPLRPLTSDPVHTIVEEWLEVIGITDRAEVHTACGAPPPR